MAIDVIRDRLLRITRILNENNIAYAVVGGNAVAAYIGQVNLTAVRATKDVDIMINRNDLPTVITATKEEGFIHSKVMGIDMLRDGPKSTARNAVHIIFENEKVRPEEPVANPSMHDFVSHPDGYRVLALQGIVQIKLTAFRNHDRTHLIDLLQQKLIDESWIQRYPSPLSDRLKELCDISEVKNYVETSEEEGN